MDGSAGAESSSEAPTRHALTYAPFRTLILAATVSYLGSFVQEVAQAWLMVELTHRAKPVAGLAALYTLPVMLLMLPAGVMADRYDRRRILIVAQLAQGAVAFALGVLAALGKITPGVLLAASFGLGVGTAIGAPPWQSLVPELVPKSRMPEAVTIGAVSFNVARAVGPAIGGVVLAWRGPAASFFVNAASFLGVVVVLWKVEAIRAASERARGDGKREGAFAALATAIRHTLRSRPLRACVVAISVFAPPAASTSAILPMFARVTLDAGARGYGSLLAALGGGAITGALALPRLRARLPARVLVACAMALFAAATLAMSQTTSLRSACVAFFVAGLGWVSSFSTLAALLQTSAPDALKSRVMAVYGLAFIGAWVVGAATGGALADTVGMARAIAVGAVMAALAAAVTSRLALPELPRPAR